MVMIRVILEDDRNSIEVSESLPDQYEIGGVEKLSHADASRLLSSAGGKILKALAE